MSLQNDTRNVVCSGKRDCSAITLLILLTELLLLPRYHRATYTAIAGCTILYCCIAFVAYSTNRVALLARSQLQVLYSICVWVWVFRFLSAFRGQRIILGIREGRFVCSGKSYVPGTYSSSIDPRIIRRYHRPSIRSIR